MDPDGLMLAVLAARQQRTILRLESDLSVAVEKIQALEAKIAESEKTASDE